MSNMSYCQFENTSNDMSQVIDTVTRVIEDGTCHADFMCGLSSEHERRGFTTLLEKCQEFIDICAELESNGNKRLTPSSTSINLNHDQPTTKEPTP
jgi:hypothetical protein